MSAPAGREQMQLPQIQQGPGAVAAMAPEGAILTVTASREGAQELIKWLLSKLDAEESSLQETEEFGKLVESLRRYQKLANLVADLATSAAVSKTTIFTPTLSFSQQVKLDLVMCLRELGSQLSACMDSMLSQLELDFEAYLSQIRESREARISREQLKSRLAELIRLAFLIVTAPPRVLLRIMAVRGIDLPPAVRNTLVNIYLLNLDIMRGRAIERLQLVEARR